MAKSILAAFFGKLSQFFNLMFGQFSWNSPPWLNYLQTQCAKQARGTWQRIFWSIVALLLVFYGSTWYFNRPEPNRIVAQITPPKMTPNEKILIPDYLIIDFGTTNGGFQSKPVAPLAMLGKPMTEGISITPSIPGQFHWESDSRLIFSPKMDWPAGQTYTIQFSKDIFSKGTPITSLSYAFSTLPFQASIKAFQFYQDPVNPQIRQAVATIDFNFPVDTASFEKRITLLWQALKNKAEENIKYTLSYDEHKRRAYLHSETLKLPPAERFIQLILGKGIKASDGPAKTTEIESATALVPDAGSYFKIKELNTSIVRNEKDVPEQVLTIETSLGLKQAALDKAIHVYVLPKDYPETKFSAAKIDYTWQNPGEVTPEILALSKSVTLSTIPADRDEANLHSYRYHANTPAYLYVKIDKGLQGFGQFTLSQDYVAVFKVPAYPQEITFLHKGAILPLGTEEKFSILVRGLSDVKFSVGRVLPADVVHLVTQTRGDFSNPYFINYSFNRNNISEIFTQIQNFDVSDPAKAQYTALDLGQYLNKTANQVDGLGLFLLQARAWDTKNNLPLEAESNRLILITDLGLLVKDNVDGTHDVYVQSISKGTPLANAAVSILGQNGVPIFTYPTDANGHVRFPNLNQYSDDKYPAVYIARLGNDLSFMPYHRYDRQLNYSRFDIGGISNYNENAAALTAFLFSDRGIYRPGDTAHLAMIVKQPYVMPQPAGTPLQATITDSRGTTVKDVKFTLDETGYSSFDFQTEPSSATGQYYVNLFIVKDNQASNLIGSTKFHVEEFLPDRLRIRAQLSAPENAAWASPTDLSIKVGLWNLFGTPAADHRMSGKLVLTPKNVYFKKEFPDYIFFDPLLNPRSPPKVHTENLTDVRTNAEGQAEFNLNLDRFDKATYQLTVFVEGFEAEGGRSVTTSTTALVSPLTYFVAYKADGDLRYISQNASRQVNLIAVDPQLKQQAVSDLSLQLFKQQPITTLVKKEDGTYQYQSLLQTTEISSTAFNIATSGSNYTLPTHDMGDFLVSIKDKAGTELSRLTYSVVGNGQQTTPRNAELNVKLNKTEFSPGEEIEMQITAPYTGAGLITIERDKVYAQQWFKTDTTSSIQTIRLPADFQGNGYINIAFVRDLNSPDIFMSPLSYHVQPFSVTHQEHDLKVGLNTPTLARPGEALNITYQTDKPSKMIVFGVDEGILQVSLYKTPDPLAYFFQKHALDVTTQQIVDQILPKFMAERELSAVGGDQAKALLNKNLNPFKRSTEAPVVFWSGIIDADKEVRTLTYQVPDYFNGNIRFMAVAVAASAVGSSSSDTKIHGYFVINPNVPTFLAPGDEVEITAGISNTIEGSGPDAKVRIELSTSDGLELIDATPQTIAIPEGQEKTVRFKARAKNQLGNATLKWLASWQDKNSHMTSSLSVRPASPYATTIMSAYTKDSSKSLSLDRNLYPEFRHVEIAASTSPLILATGLQYYLNTYPYGCVEQLVSKAFPWLVMSKQTWFAKDKNTIENKIQETMQMLSQRQMSTGAFSYWPGIGANESNDFASIYAMHFLTDAKAAGFAVANDIYTQGLAFLSDFVTKEVNDLNQARLQAYAIYLLSRNEIVVASNYLTHLQLVLNDHPNWQWQNDITTVYLAATYQLLKNTKEAERLLKLYRPQAKTSDNSDFNNPAVARAEYLYLLAQHFPDHLKQIDETFILSLARNLNQENISTLIAAYSSLALGSYGQLMPLPQHAKLSINGASTDGLYQIAELDQQSKTVTIENPNQLGFFYQLTQSGFDQTLAREATQSGIEVYREYRHADNSVATGAKLGEELFVHLRVRSTDNNWYNNIAIVDLLPGGFEVVRESVKSNQVDYAEAREDRVLYFTGIGPESKEIIYRIKATNTGEFTVPPAYGVAMYHPLIKSLGLASKINIRDA